MPDMGNFNFKRNYNDIFGLTLLSVGDALSPEDTLRLQQYRRRWNFYDGYHWEEIASQDKPEVTENYCRAFVNKFVAFEFGKGFTVTYRSANEIVDDEGTTLQQYMKDLWTDNTAELFCAELGQMKSITGDAWVQVRYFSPDEINDPFGEYEKGRIRVMVVPTSIVFPEYDEHDKDRLTKLTIQYPIKVEEETGLLLKRSVIKTIVYKQVWTNDTVEEYRGREKISSVENPYNTIPFVQVKNFTVAGRNEGLSDLEDLIPLNVELNMKKSDISEIIDYHAAPVTIVFGAKVSALEKGANKLWGGLPKDAKVENLELSSDLGASVNYVRSLKEAMQEVVGVPEGSLGGTQAISNTSGVALQFVNMPIIERTRIKRLCSQTGLQRVNKLLILLSLVHEFIKMPEEVKPKDFFYNETKLPDTLPKDELLELQAVEQEMKMGIESRKGAMKRLGKEDIDKKIEEIDEDRSKNPEAYAIQPKINSGMTNGQTPVEQVRKEINGANMPKG